MIRYLLPAMLLAQPATAQFETPKLATRLGTVIGSESYFGLTLQQDAIEACVRTNAPKDDKSFAQTLTMMIQGTEINLAQLSPSARTAHCAAVARSARDFGFID